jgi:hypothetical protein
MIREFKCTCGNKDPKKAKEYDGSLGYEAIVCKVCGTYYDLDNDGKGRTNPPDEWSLHFVGLPNIQAGDVVKLKRKPTNENNATIVFRGVRFVDYQKKIVGCDDNIDYNFKDIIMSKIL